MQYKNQDGMNLTPPLPSIIIIIFSPPAQSRRQENIQNYRCNGNFLCYHGVVERNRISSLESHGKAYRKRNVVSRVSSVIVLIRLPISIIIIIIILNYYPR